jgi:integrase
LGREVAEEFRVSRLPSRADRRRMLLGHVVTEMPANPLAPKKPHRRHPKMPPEGARERLAESLLSARDRMTVTWLAHGGFRVGELCGLHLVDLHLRLRLAARRLRPVPVPAGLHRRRGLVQLS